MNKKPTLAFLGIQTSLGRKFTGSLSVAFALFLGHPASAATLTWDTAGPTNTWTTTTGNANWLAGPVEWTDGNAAVFDNATGEAITINGTVSPTSVTVGAGNGTWSFAGSGSIGGTSSLTKAGTGVAGKLTISTANTYSGVTTINAGVINIQNNTALGNTTGATTLANSTGLELQGGIIVTGETLNIIGNGNNGNTGALRNISGDNEWAGTINVNTVGFGSRMASDSGTLTLSGDVVISGPNQLVLTGLGIGLVSGNISGGAAITTGNLATTWILSGSNSYTGATTVNALSNLQIGNGGTTGSLSTSSTIVNSGTLIFNRSNAVAQGTDFTSTAISGAGALTQNGTGTLALSSANTYTGNTTVSVGTLLVNTVVAGTDSGTGTGSVSVSALGTLGGTGQITPGTGKQITVASGGTIAPGAGIGTLTLNGVNTAATVLSLTSGATFAFELNTGFQSDTIALLNGAAGDIAFSGNAINFSDLSGGSLAPGAYTLFTATAANNYGGTFAVDGSGFVTAGLSIGTGLGAYTGSTLQLVGNNIVLNVVPEPSAWALIAGAGTFLMVMRRRRRD